MRKATTNITTTNITKGTRTSAMAAGKKVTLALAAAAMAFTMTACGSNSAGSADTTSTAAGPAKPYFSLVEIVEGAQVPIYNATYFQDNGDGTYTLFLNNTLDISEASSGYLSTVGGGKVLYGDCTVADQDGETVYTLSQPSRVVMSAYMMTGPDSTTEIYVDSADSATYSNYTPADITSMSETDVIDQLLKTSVSGDVADEASFDSTIVVDVDKFQITDMY